MSEQDLQEWNTWRSVSPFEMISNIWSNSCWFLSIWTRFWAWESVSSGPLDVGMPEMSLSMEPETNSFFCSVLLPTQHWLLCSQQILWLAGWLETTILKLDSPKLHKSSVGTLMFFCSSSYLLAMVWIWEDRLLMTSILSFFSSGVILFYSFQSSPSNIQFSSYHPSWIDPSGPGSQLWSFSSSCWWRRCTRWSSFDLHHVLIIHFLYQ